MNSEKEFSPMMLKPCTASGSECPTTARNMAKPFMRVISS